MKEEGTPIPGKRASRACPSLMKSAGLYTALEGMKIKEKRCVTIPPQFGYKNEIWGSVPARSTLIVGMPLHPCIRLQAYSRMDVCILDINPSTAAQRS